MIKLFKICMVSFLPLGYESFSSIVNPWVLVCRSGRPVNHMCCYWMLFFFCFFPWPQTSNSNAYNFTEYSASEENTDISQELSPEKSVVTKSISSNKLSAHPSTLLQCSESGHHRGKSKANGKITLWLFLKQVLCRLYGLCVVLGTPLAMVVYHAISVQLLAFLMAFWTM